MRRILLLPILLVACSRPDRTPCPTSGERPVHVVIFLIDTLRADKLGTYGFDQESSPAIDALALESVVFESASAAAPWTLPSVVSLMTSSFLPEHRVTKDGERLDPSVPTLASRLKDAGYSTGSVFHNPYAGPMSGLDKGFDLVEQAKKAVGAADLEDWLDGNPSCPFFLYLHNTVPHDPYEPDPKYLRPLAVSEGTPTKLKRIQDNYRDLTRKNNARRRWKEFPDNSAEQTALLEEMNAISDEIEALYVGDVSMADAHVGEVIATLKREDLWRDTLFILVSDHGEELGEHGGWEHDQSSYEELVHVPLIVHFPDDAHAGTRVADPVSIVDVMPTILEVIGETSEANLSGQSLLPLLTYAEDVSPARVTSYRFNRKKLYTPWKETRGDENIVVRQGSWKAIWNVEPDTLELYDLGADPGETNNLATKEAERAALLLELARSSRLEFLSTGGELSAEPEEATLTDEQRDRLRALGYLSEDE